MVHNEYPGVFLISKTKGLISPDVRCCPAWVNDGKFAFNVERACKRVCALEEIGCSVVLVNTLINLENISAAEYG
jgi:hypothetical protein